MPIQRNGHRLPRLSVGGAGDGQILPAFGGVNDVISGQWIDAQRRGLAVDGNGAGGVAGIAAEIRHRSGNRHRAVRQISHRGGRYRQTPGAISLHGSGKTLSSQGYCDGLSCLGLLSATGKGQWRTFFCATDNVIAGDGVNGDQRRNTDQRDCSRRRASISCSICHGDENRIGSAIQRAGYRRVQRHIPAAICQHDARQDMSAQFHRYRIARRSTADLSGDDLRDGLLGIIKNIVARHGVNADHGC